MTTPDFAAAFADTRAFVERGIADLCARRPEGTPERLMESMAYSLTAGGKRLRPVLTVQAAALFGIPAVKGVEFGLGFEAACRPGSQVHDPIGYEEGIGFTRASNNAGGLEGGMTNGQPLVIALAMKPIPTLRSPLRTVDLVTHEPREASRERSDVCAVPACGVVAEAEVALVLADAYCRRFGDANMDDLMHALDAYRRRIAGA